MNYLSTGEPSTLGTYKKLARIFGKKAEDFIQRRIDESPNREDEEVIVVEQQMLVLLASFLE